MSPRRWAKKATTSGTGHWTFHRGFSAAVSSQLIFKACGWLHDDNRLLARGPGTSVFSHCAGAANVRIYQRGSNMNLGAFSVSLNVNDIDKSQTFYQTLGFVPIGGNAEEGWLIMKNSEHIIGLFQQILEHNVLTFNPGWNQAGENSDPFTDIRELRDTLVKAGIEVHDEIATPAGPGSLMLRDPDGNAILIDQHR